MDWYWIAAIIVAIALVLAIASRGKERPKRINLFRQRDSLFTKAERSFIGVLDQA